MSVIRGAFGPYALRRVFRYREDLTRSCEAAAAGRRDVPENAA